VRHGYGLGGIIRGAFTTRGASLGSGGSGAPAARRLAALLSASTAIAGLMALTAATAAAVPLHPFLETFGSAAQPSFDNPSGIAIYQATGDVYVMDNGSPASIKRYKPDGTPDNFSALGTNVIDGAGGADLTPEGGLGFASPAESQIAVDNSGSATDGNIYVTQSSPNAINVFSATGAYLGRLTGAGATPFTEACGVAVDPAGAVYVGDYSSGIHKFVPAANPPVNADHTTTFTSTTNPCTLAAGSGAAAGFLFPAQYNGPISKIDSSTGDLKYSFSEGVRTVSADPASGNVYAAKGSEFQEFDASGAGSATQLSADSLAGGLRGIAVRGSNGQVFVAREGSTKLEAFGALVHSPNVTATAATGITATGATINGTVNPEGVALTECKFEWGPTTQSGFPNSAPCEQAVPADSADHAVSAHISGLSASGSQYRFRLVAKNADTSSTSAVQTFHVGAAINGTAASAGSEEATLLGAVVPSGGATEYHFEWGATSSYGNTTPAGNLPAGEQALAVFAELSGLSSGTTYHYRLVATNGLGTTTGPDQAFTTSTAPQPLPQRGYENASQYPTGGVPIIEGATEPPALQIASEDGNGIALTTPNPLPHSTLPPMPDDPLDTGLGGEARNLFTRGSDGWQRTEVGLGGYSWSGDLQRFLTTTQTQAPGSNYTWEDARVDPDDQNKSVDLYQWQPDGKLTWISRDPRIPVGTPQTAEGNAELASGVGAFTMSADGRTVVFNTRRQLLDADTTPTSGPSARARLYKWEDGQLSFIGVRPDGSVPADGSQLGGYSSATSARYAVSRDGSRVIFSALRRDGVGGSGSTGAGLYIQTDGQPTVEATKEEGVPPLPAPEPYAVTYRGAAANGSRVFFTTASRFTPDSGGTFADDSDHEDDLYVYDVAADKLRDLTPRLDGIEDPSVDPPVSDQARVLGVAANSEDGKRVYFVAEGQLPTAPNPEGELPQASSPNLYMAELDSIDGPVKLRFVATLSDEEDSFSLVLDEGDWQAGWGGRNGPNNVNVGKTALASADGSVLGFGSHESLTGQPLGGTEQLFVYDAGRDRLECASCPSNGTLPAASVNEYSLFGGSFSNAVWQSISGVRRWISDKGTVFFTTSTPLLPADENTVADVYESREGQLRLLSTGKGTSDSLLSDASVDGSTVFINTREALAPQDKEPGINKIYAARVGGGFPYTPPPAPCDFNAGACEGAPSTAPETPGAGTAAFAGPGNPKPATSRGCPKGKRKVRAKGKTRCVTRHGRAHHKRNANNNRRAGR
jgi:hypothetical protein